MPALGPCIADRVSTNTLSGPGAIARAIEAAAKPKRMSESGMDRLSRREKLLSTSCEQTNKLPRDAVTNH